MGTSLLLAGLLAASTLSAPPARAALADPEATRAARQDPAVARAPGAPPKVSPYAKANRRRAQAAAAAPADRGHHPVRKAPRSGGARK